MKAARIQIGRVRMKNGGADVRVIHRDNQGSVVAGHMREWVTGALNKERPPDAYAAVALWFDAERPGRPAYQATYCTEIDAIPAPVLVRMAASYLIADHAAQVGACRAVETMGGEVEDWTPDDAS